jgi:hypothetical protein
MVFPELPGIARLDDCGIPYMITGSFASNVQGVPRATQDADIIIESNQKSLDQFIESLGIDFYASRQGGPANRRDIQHCPSGNRIQD